MQQNCNCRCPSKEELLQMINEVSFVVMDIVLYLDTHPCDMEAMEIYRKYVAMRKKALKEYAQHYGPLTIDTADESLDGKWEWVMQPWPWENKGGGC